MFPQCFELGVTRQSDVRVPRGKMKVETVARLVDGGLRGRNTQVGSRKGRIHGRSRMDRFRDRNNRSLVSAPVSVGEPHRLAADGRY